MEKVSNRSALRSNLSLVLDEVQFNKDSYVIERKGRPAAVIVPLAVYDNWKRSRQRFFETVKQIQKANQIEVIVSLAIIAEIDRVLGYERLQKKYRRLREEHEGLIDDLRNFATIVEPQQTLPAVPDDESDNRYVECAVLLHPTTTVPA